MTSESALFETVSPALAAGIALVYALLLAAGTVTAVLIARAALRRSVPWKTYDEVIRNRALGGRDVLMICGLVLILVLATLSVASLLRQASPSILLLLQSIGLDVAGLVALVAYLRHRGFEWNRVLGLVGPPSGRSLRMGLILYLGVLPLVFFSSMVYQGVLSANGYPPTLQDIALLLTADNPLWLRLYMMFMAVVLAPVFEECLFRGILFPLFARKLGLGSGIFISSLLFASIHFHAPSLVPLCVVAIGFAMGYLVSGSLWVPVTMHALFNGVNLGLLMALRQ
jgi:membrane protease YdiL (CAAX protease family)